MTNRLRNQIVAAAFAACGALVGQDAPALSAPPRPTQGHEVVSQDVPAEGQVPARMGGKFKQERRPGRPGAPAQGAPRAASSVEHGSAGHPVQVAATPATPDAAKTDVAKSDPVRPATHTRKYPSWVKVIVWPPDPNAKTVRPEDKLGYKSADAKAQDEKAAKSAKAAAGAKHFKRANPHSKKLRVQGAEGLREDDLKLVSDTLGWLRAGTNRKVYLDAAPAESAPKVKVTKAKSAKAFAQNRDKVQKALRNAGVQSDAVKIGACPSDAAVAPTGYVLSNGVRLTLVTLAK